MTENVHGSLVYGISPFPQVKVFEHRDASSPPNTQALVFIPGLTEEIGSVEYVRRLADYLREHAKTWTVVEIQTRTANDGWSYHSLDDDVEDLVQTLNYLSRKYTQIVVMGHSTGCQVIMHYLNHHTCTIQNFILQASASDREYHYQFYSRDKIGRDVEEARRCLRENAKFLPFDLCSPYFQICVSPQRFISLLGHNEADDYFSSDLTDEEIAKKFSGIQSNPNAKLTFLYSESDEYVPDFVDKKCLLDGFKKACPGESFSPLSQIVPKADHAVTNLESQRVLFDVILKVLERSS